MTSFLCQECGGITDSVADDDYVVVCDLCRKKMDDASMTRAATVKHLHSALALLAHGMTDTEREEWVSRKVLEQHKETWRKRHADLASEVDYLRKVAEDIGALRDENKWLRAELLKYMEAEKQRQADRDRMIERWDGVMRRLGEGPASAWSIPVDVIPKEKP
jgi:cation transport regulator ChaC